MTLYVASILPKCNNTHQNTPLFNTKFPFFSQQMEKEKTSTTAKFLPGLIGATTTIPTPTRQPIKKA